ncbi:redox-sensing transcriptional repressor Rex [Dethiosulfovibrio sp. F2B]|uniref:redox-sensing transcriptional repressor Rex n=1 Tax=Dethiosulfovibrio faecalis TaxID=2720018 RepID=UPI001F21E9BE|nr:redox-sensing transcriptional repressor Rex [Dethiosulfovibrio faecalis]MCF4152210.1 redox-sensing transcriptional repressor Rex [Dethiosulfovibrio faecalis]
MKVAEPTVERLVQYRRLLEHMDRDKVQVISSKEIGDMLGFKASQVRKDLSYFGEIGKRGVGYNVDRLLKHVSDILSPPRKWSVGLVGVGRLGEALLDHKAFLSDKYEIVALFDVSEEKVGKTFFGRPCFHVDDMSRKLKDMDIEILILTVPKDAAQRCVDAGAENGQIKGILNFSPSSVVAPPGVIVYSVDISVELEKLLFYLKHEGTESI